MHRAFSSKWILTNSLIQNKSEVGDAVIIPGSLTKLKIQVLKKCIYIYNIVNKAETFIALIDIDLCTV